MRIYIHLYKTGTILREGLFMKVLINFGNYLASIKGIINNYDLLMVIIISLLLALFLCIVLSKKYKLYEFNKKDTSEHQKKKKKEVIHI